MAYPSDLDKWVRQLGPALGLADAAVDVGGILDLASAAAHAVARPAAPLTTYLVGMAVGRGVSFPDAVAIVSRMTADPE